MFLLLFNLSISLIGVLSIYNIGVSPPSTYNVSDYAPASSPDQIVWRFLGTTLSGIMLGVAAGAMTSWLTKIPTDAGIAYGVFTGVFWGITYNTVDVIWRIGTGIPGAVGVNAGIFVVIVIFVGITGIVFAYGLVQLIRGGWKGYK